MTALTIPVTGTLLEYRGQRYPLHSGGDVFVRLATPTPPRDEDFPDALELNDDPLDPWVKQAHRGPIAPGFGASGGGVQVELPLPVNVMIGLGMMREIP